MKCKLISAVVGMLLSAGLTQAADLGLSESTIDYGTVKEGPPVIKTVILTNDGNQPMTIAGAAAS